MAASESTSSLANANNANDKIAMLKKHQQMQRAQYERKKTQLTGVKKIADRGPGTMGLAGAMTLEDMNLDRKTQFQGDAFDPFKVG